MDIYPFRAWYPNLTRIQSPNFFFGNVKEKYVAFQKENYFTQLPASSLFITRIQSLHGTFTGLVAGLSVEEYTQGKVRKHEQTLAAKEKKVLALFLERQANIKPVLLAYPAVDAITQFLGTFIQSNPLFFEVKLEDQVHEFWKIEQPEAIRHIQELFKTQVATTYIADGHHRASTMKIVQHQYQQKEITSNFGPILVALFDSKQLRIHEFNTIVKTLDRIESTTFIKELSYYGAIQPLKQAKKPTQKYTLSLFLNKQWYQFSWKEAIIQQFSKATAPLDVQLLNEIVLKRIIGIQDIRSDERVQYVEGTKGLNGLIESTKKDSQNVGFYLYPIQIPEFMVMADQGLLLPPKSTYFVPRIKNGMLVKRAEN